MYIIGKCEAELTFTADRLALLVEQQTAVREVTGSNLGQTNTQGL